MAENICGYVGARDDALVSYVYEEMDPPGRAAFERHLLACGACQDELEALRGVRAQLGQWAPPEPGRAETVAAATVAGTPFRWWQQVPAWAQVAAAVLCVGVAAGFANLDVRYDREGLTVRTGWSKQPAAPAPAASSPSEVPWRADLAALEQRMRTEMRSASIAMASARPAPSTTVPASASAPDPNIVRRVQALLDESERKQQRELALRVAQIVRDVDAQRRADLVKIERSLGQVQDNTGVEVMRQRELLNYLVRVSQKP
jgi:hypothetical protein